jgi:hypothetical protein
VSEKAKRWQRYSYLGRLKQAENVLRELAKQDFVDEELAGLLRRAAVDVSFLTRQTKLAIEVKK